MNTTETNDTEIMEMMQTLMNEGMQGFPDVMSRMYGPSAIAVKRSDADLDFPRREVHDLELEVLEVAQAVGLLHQ